MRESYLFQEIALFYLNGGESMGWKFGIPDELGPYTYFNTLNTTLTDDASIAKKKLYNMAEAEMKRGLTQLNDIQKIQAATDFIKQVADSERGKELAAIQSYCKETQEDFHALKPYLDNPSSIYENPDKFYTQLTAAISKIRMGTQDYLLELKKIKKRMDSIGDNGKNTRTFFTYLFDDYRYKLVEDITTFMAHLTHHESWIKDMLRHDFKETEFNTKIEAMVIRILKTCKIEERIASGEDFAAIAASVLVDLEKMIQREIDESLGKESSTISKISDNLLEKVEKNYMKQLQMGGETPVQKALNNVQGIDFARITTNAKELLGINIPELQEDKQKVETSLSLIDKQQCSSTNELKSKIKKGKISLDEQLKLINFSIAGSFFTKQGAINELILSMLGSNVKKNVATDVITYKINWQTQINTKAMDTLVRNIGDEFGSVLGSEESKGPANKTDIQLAITRMQQNVDKLIKEAEDQLHKSKNYDSTKDLFVFHETLKLYSTVETGRGAHAGFGGRNMNILSYLDYLSSAASIGVKNNIDRDTLAFFARNLINGAIAEGQKAPLERYFSIYAGMIMFDDVVAMAREAVSQINNSNNIIGGRIRQVHLYNLNGIYVPASMILTYLSDSLNKNNQKIIEDMMTVHITTATLPGVSRSTKSSKRQKEQQRNKKIYENYISSLGGDSSNLTESDWDAVSSMAVSATKVQIIFLASFEQFINNLFGIQ